VCVVQPRKCHGEMDARPGAMPMAVVRCIAAPMGGPDRCLAVSAVR